QKSTKSTKYFQKTMCAVWWLSLISVGGKNVVEPQNVIPRVVRDLPARNLAYRLSADVTPPSSDIEDLDKFAAVANDFSTKRKDEILLRTVVSPDGRRVLAFYGGGCAARHTIA